MSSATTPSSASGLYVPVHKRPSPTGSPMSFVVNELPPVPMAYSIADLLQMRSTSANEIMRQRLLEACPQIVYDPENPRKLAENKRQWGGVLSSASSSGAKRRSTSPTPSTSSSTSSPSSKHSDLPLTTTTHNNHTRTSSNGSRKKKPAHMTIQVPKTVMSETQIDNDSESVPEDALVVQPVFSTVDQQKPATRKSRSTQTTSASSRPPCTAGSATRNARRNNQQRRPAFGHGAFGQGRTATSAHADSWRRGDAVAPVLSVVVA